MLPLKTTLLLNGSTSGFTGAGLIIFRQPMAELFGLPSPAAFLATGIFLVMFALLVIAVSLKKPLPVAGVKLVTLLDMVWVLASIITVVIMFSSISLIGSAVIIAVAGWVGLMAYLQLQGMRTMDVTPSV